VRGISKWSPRCIDNKKKQKSQFIMVTSHLISEVFFSPSHLGKAIEQ